MNLLKKLTNKNLRLNKKRTVVTIIGIILSVALITAVATMFLSLYKSLIVMEITTEGNYHVSFIDVDDESLKTIKENRYIESYYQTKDIGYAKLEGSKNTSKPYLFIAGFPKDSLENLSVNLIEGRLPENDHELLISRHIKNNGRVEFNIGDKLTLNIGERVMDGETLTQLNPYGDPYKPDYDEFKENEIPHEEIVNTKEYTYTVVGIIERPSYGVEGYSAPGYTCITYDEKPTGKTTVYVRFTKDGLEHTDKVIANIMGVDEKAFYDLIHVNYETEEEYEKLSEEVNKAKVELGDYNRYLTMLERGIFKYDAFRRFSVIIGVICLIIVVTSIFCIKNSFDISIAEKTKQYGMLSSVGATKKQIKKNVYYEAFRLGIVGIPLGIILGLIASAILVVICNGLLKDMLTAKMVFATSIGAIAFGAVLGIITLFLSSMYSAQKASRISPIKAIINSEDIKIKSKKIKSPKFIKKIFGVGGEIAYKNLKRSKKKYRTTVISIIVCVAVYIALSTFMSTFYQYMTLEYAAKDYNIEIYINADDFNRVDEKIKPLLSREDVKDYSNEEYEYSNIKNAKVDPEYKKNVERHSYWLEDNKEQVSEYFAGDVNILRLGDHQYRKYLKELNLDYESTKNKGIMLPQVEYYDETVEKNVKKIAMNYKKGDVITVADFEFDEHDNLVTTHGPKDFELAAVTTKRPFGFSEINQVPILVISDEEYRAYAGEKMYYERYYFDVENPDKFQDELEDTLKEEQIEITNIDKEQKRMKSLHLLIAIFLYGFIAVIALIGLTNIFNTITTNMELRKREFASLRSIGMTTKEFNRMISLESLFYGTKSLLIGIPLGILLSYYLNVLLSEGEDIVIYKIPFVSIIVSIILVFVLITIIMKYSISKINKQNTIETIRNENI